MKKATPQSQDAAGSASLELLVGIHSVESALNGAPGGLSALYVAEECRNRRVQQLRSAAGRLEIPVKTVPRAELDRRSQSARHQDIIAEFRPDNLYGEKDLDTILDGIEGQPLLLVLDGVQDPHNLGACLRSADAVGVNLVILPKDHSAGLTLVARRAASGAAEVVPVLFAANLARVLRRLKERGIWLLGTSDTAETNIHEMDLGGPMALVMGSEGRGMRRLTAELCDFHARIPMRGTVTSLNVSVATGVCLFEMARQRSEK